MNKDSIINWINNEIMRNQVYHDHKETMMWVATAFHVSGVITLGFLLRENGDCVVKITATTFAVVATVLMMIFVHWQF